MTNAVTLASLANSGYLRNRIINGAMMIDQRNAGASVTANDGVYIVDRIRMGAAQSSKFTGQQNAGGVTPPAGFTNYIGFTSSSAYTPLTNDYFFMGAPIEGYNVADFNWGTSNAKTITVSFWVRSSLTGSFGGSIQAGKSYTFSYTISSANTWEYKTITIAGDTSSSMVSITNGLGLQLIFALGSGSGQQTAAGTWTSGGYVAPPGSVNVCATNGATFYVTGLQLEVGTQATPFEWRPYPTEFDMCCRYYQKFRVGNEGYIGSASTNTTDGATFLTSMRTAPSATFTVRQAGGTTSLPNAYLPEVWGMSVYVGVSANTNYNWHVDGTANAEF